MSKYELAQKYNISLSTLRNLLNVRFYNELVPLGYLKRQIILSPCVVRKFIEMYGEPLKKDEI